MISKQESVIAETLHDRERMDIGNRILDLQAQLKLLSDREQELGSQQPTPFWVRQAQSVQDRGLRAHVTAQRTWNTLALGKVLAVFTVSLSRHPLLITLLLITHLNYLLSAWRYSGYFVGAVRVYARRICRCTRSEWGHGGPCD